MSAAGLVAQLARAVQRLVPRPGDQPTLLRELSLHRRNRPCEPVHCVYTVGMALTLQGSKQVRLGDSDLSYGPGQSLLTAIDLPVSYHVVRATVAEPYLGIMLKLDKDLIAQTASKFEPPRAERGLVFEPISLQRLDAPVLDALYRLISLFEEPALLPTLAPLIQQEIIVRLLHGPHARHLWQLANAASPTHPIAQAVAWIRQNLAEEMRVESLAKTVGMSVTTFRQHFKIMAGMSPVQFQKFLRLQEARQLMLNQDLTASSASALVGYESVSQFNREYRRLFGAPPQRDIRRLVGGEGSSA